MNYEFTYITIHYTCGHTVIRPVLKSRADAERRYPDKRCHHCHGQGSRPETASIPESFGIDTQWPPVAQEVAS